MRRLAIIGLLLASVSPALAEEVLFADMRSGSRESEHVGAAFGKAAEGARLQVVLKDIDGDRQAEIFARAVGERQCGKDLRVCPTRVLKFKGGEYRSVFSRNVGRLDMEGVGFGAVTGLVADDTTWSWNGSRYKMDVVASGARVEMKAAPANYARPLIAQFGAGATALAEKEAKVEVRFAAVELEPGKGKVVLARLEGPGVCGQVFGCPVRVLRTKGGSYEILMEGFGKGAIAVMKGERQGWRDVTMELPDEGYATFGWSGQRYGVADLSQGEK